MPADIARLVPPGAALIEFGSGSSVKARILLAAAPTDRRLCAGRHLTRDAGAGSRQGPARFSAISPCCRSRPISPSRSACRRRSPTCRASDSFPARPSAISSRTRRPRSCATRAQMLGRGATLIIGVDLVKDPAVLNAAYNDAAGVTAKFNLNLLTRINRELGANFDLDGFLPPGVLQFRASPHRDASRQQEAAEGARGRPHDRVPRGRDDPHREQLQIHARSRSARWRAARAGRRRRYGPTTTKYFSVQALVAQDE